MIHLHALRSALAATIVLAAPAALALPAGFTIDRVIEGLNLPTSVEFARDGRVFVTEQRGVVKVFDSILDPTPDIFADLRTKVHVRGDRGLLGLALHPDFPEQPYVYVTYAYDGGIGAGDEPRWGGVDTDADDCVENVPNGGCPIGGRLSRLTAEGNVALEEVVLIEDWYQQFTFHSIGMPAFGADGQLYVTGGEGALTETLDYGQFNNPAYPDTGSPTWEGGSLRVQDLETDGDPVGLSGTLIRVDPITGAASPGNPLYAETGIHENARRILAYGMRNPFRFTFRPGTSEPWIADVGSTEFEEINRVPDPATPGATVLNFGWPCYEGNEKQPIWANAELPICENIYAGIGRFPYVPPEYSYGRDGGDGSITGVAFYTGDRYPPAYAGSLFYADFTGARLYTMADANDDGIPDGASALALFAAGVDGVVELQPGPGGDIFLAKLNFGDNPTTDSRIERIRFGGNTAPSAALVLAAGSTWTGPARSVTFDAGRSLDPDSGSADPALQQLTFSWDLDGDGTFVEVLPERIFADRFEDTPVPAGGATATASFSTDGRHRVAVKVTDAGGATDVATMDVIVGNTAPSAHIAAPSANLLWTAGTPLALDADMLDLQDDSLPDSAFEWDITLLHCPDNTCHPHPQTSMQGRSRNYTPPAHAYPSYLRVQLTVTDSGGKTGTRILDLMPATATINVASEPSGLLLSVGSEQAATPFQHTVIVGSPVTVSASSTQSHEGAEWTFNTWSNGEPRLHSFTPALPGPLTLSATYQQQ